MRKGRSNAKEDMGRGKDREGMVIGRDRRVGATLGKTGPAEGYANGGSCCRSYYNIFYL